MTESSPAIVSCKFYWLWLPTDLFYTILASCLLHTRRRVLAQSTYGEASTGRVSILPKKYTNPAKKRMFCWLKCFQVRFFTSSDLFESFFVKVIPDESLSFFQLFSFFPYLKATYVFILVCDYPSNILRTICKIWQKSEEFWPFKVLRFYNDDNLFWLLSSAKKSRSKSLHLYFSICTF